VSERQRFILISRSGIAEEKRPEDYLVCGFIDFDDISYDKHAALLYKLSGQVVKHLQSYLSNEDALLTSCNTTNRHW
jgi:type III restriction enzyme